MRFFRCLFWFLVGVLLAGVAEFSFAAGTVPKLGGYQAFSLGGRPDSACLSSAQAACDAAAAPYNDKGILSGSSFPYKCTIPKSGGYDFVYPCGSSSCPANSTANSSGSCDCSSGYTPQGGQCVKQDDCSKLKGTDAAFQYKGTYSATSHPKSNCHNGCNINYWGFSETPGGAGYSAGYAATGTYDGTTCTAPPDGGQATSDAEKDCVKSGKGFMTINGKTVCTDASTTSQDKNTNTTSTKTDANGNTTSIPGGSSTSNTTCTGDNCTTTTTTTNPDGTTSTKTDNQDKKSFCQENPSSFVCKNSSAAGSADCSAPPECDGEAVMCAQLKQNWELYCAMNKTGKETDLYDQSAAGTDPSSASQLAANAATVNVPTSLDTTDSIGGSCPSDVVISIAGTSRVLRFSRACEPLQWFGNILVALNLLAAGIFLAYSVRS